MSFLVVDNRTLRERKTRKRAMSHLHERVGDMPAVSAEYHVENFQR